MSEDQRAQGTQEAPEGEGQAPEPEENPQRSREDEDAAPSPEEEEERIPKSELNKKNKEAQNLRRERNELKKRLDAIDNEKLTEQQRLERRIEELEGSLQERDSEIEAHREDRKRFRFVEQINLPSASLAYKALDELPVAAEFDDGGNLTNVNQVRKALRAFDPRVWGNGSADGGERAAPVATVDMNDLLRNRGRR